VNAVTSEHVRQWIKDLEKVEAEIAEKTSVALALAEKVKAAAVLGLVPSPEVDGEPEEEVAAGDVSLPAAVLDLMRELSDAGKGSVEAAYIRSKLIDRGWDSDRIGSHRPWLYNSLKRLVDRGDLKARSIGNTTKYELSK
jgi:hypothetical protein